VQPLFPPGTPDPVSCAIERAVANFEILAKQAEAGAVEWRLNNGVGLFVDRFLKIATFNKRPLESS
jgi:hypothetical protein